MSIKRRPRTIRGWVAYVASLSAMMVGTMYLFMRVFGWGLFLSAPLSSLLSVGVAYVACRWAERTLGDSGTADQKSPS